MLKLWTEDQIVEYDGQKYLNEEASKKFYDALGEMIENNAKDKFVFLSEAENILNDLETSMFEECVNIFSNQFNTGEEISGKDAFECIKKIGLILVSNGYPDTLVDKNLLKEFGELLTNKYENFSFDDDFVYYEILLDGIKNNSVDKLIKQSDDIWGIHLILKLCRKYNLSDDAIDPKVIDNWLLTRGYYVEPKKSQAFLKSLCSIIDKPDDYLCGELITKYFSNKYDIAQAVKNALTSPVALEDYEKNQTGLTIQDAYKKVTQVYLKEYSEKEDLKEKDIFGFIENIPHMLLSSGFNKNIIRKIKFTNIEINLKRLFENFKLNDKNFELYLTVKNKLQKNSLENVLVSAKNNKELYEDIYASYKYELSNDNIDFNLLLSKMNSVLDLVNFIKLIKEYEKHIESFNAETVDSWLSKYYDDSIYTPEIIELIEVLSPDMDITLFFDKFDMNMVKNDYTSNSLKAFNSYEYNDEYIDDNELEEEEVYTIKRTRPIPKVTKVYSFIAGSGIISFIQVAYITKKNPVPTAREFQQLAVVSGLIDEIGSFETYIKTIVINYKKIMEESMKVSQKGSVR